MIRTDGAISLRPPPPQDPVDGSLPDSSASDSEFVVEWQVADTTHPEKQILFP